VARLVLIGDRSIASREGIALSSGALSACRAVIG
jgi:hypothetical protein